MGTHHSKTSSVRSHDSSNALRNLSVYKQDDGSSRRRSRSSSVTSRHSSKHLSSSEDDGSSRRRSNSSVNSRQSSKHVSSSELGTLREDGVSDSFGKSRSLSSSSNHSSMDSVTTMPAKDTPKEPLPRNLSFGDIYRLKEAAKNQLHRNFSSSDVRKTKSHELHSVSKRVQSALKRSESLKEYRDKREVVFKKDFQTQYSCDLQSPISHGRYAYVTAGLSYITRETVAVKIIHKDKLIDRKNGKRCAGEDIRAEVIALRYLANQPNVVKFLDVFEDEAFFYIVMELCKGGNLLERINKVKVMKEEEAGPIVKQMLAATLVCHSHGIAHRDLKLENFVFFSENENYPLKLVDFGSAGFFRDGQTRPFKGAAGTFNYMAPEVFDNNYGAVADVWSLGVVAYSMLCGNLPFPGNNCETLKEMIQQTEVDFSHPAWEEISVSAKDLVSKMLEKNPDYRITVEEALRHSWFNERGGGWEGGDQVEEGVGEEVIRVDIM